MSIQILLDEIKTNLTKILNDLNFPSVLFSVEPAKKGFGDVTCNVCFLLAKNLSQKPNEIAQKISENYNKHLGDLVAKVEAHPSGFLNFFINWPLFTTKIFKDSQNLDYGSPKLGKKFRVVVEHTSVNPNKALHIGHVRNVVIGDSLARILRKYGHPVTVLNYVDDFGLQVADLLIGIERFENEGKVNPKTGMGKDREYEYIYEYITREFNSLPFEEVENLRKNTVLALESGNNPISDKGLKVTEDVLNAQLKTCLKLGAEYDCLNYESHIVHSGMWDKIFEKLKKSELIEKEQSGKNMGCWVIRGNKKEDDKVIVRSNGTATYIAKDIPYAFWKLGLVDDPFYYEELSYHPRLLNRTFKTTLAKTGIKKDFSGDKVITVIDSRQQRLQQIIKNIVSKFTNYPDSYIHLAYESVTLSKNTAKKLGKSIDSDRVQMSGREGLVVWADAFLDNLEYLIQTEKMDKYLNTLSHDEIVFNSKKIALAILRYEMIKIDLDKMITFDIDAALSLEGDTAAYILYSLTRAKSILGKTSTTEVIIDDYSILSSPCEIELIKIISMYEFYVLSAAQNFSPKVIAKYCHAMAVNFHSFYENVQVLNTPSLDLTNARISLVRSFEKTLENALDLLGIRAPEIM